MDELNKIIQDFKSWESSELIIKFSQFIIWLLVILLISWLIRKSIAKKISDNSTRYRIKKLVRIGSYVLIIILIIILFTGNFQYFTVSIGLISAAIAFALQEVVLSIAGWFAIFGSNMYKPGDRININNIKGDVIDIGITKTTLMEIGDWVSSDNYNGRIVKISNSFVFKGAVHNYSTDFPFVWDEINLPIKYGSDINIANKIIQESANIYLSKYTDFAKEHWKLMVNKYLIEDAIVESTLTLKLTDNWIEFNLRYVVDYKKRRVTKNAIFTKILDEISKTNGKVLLASATYEVVGIPPINVEISNKK
ncbi:mechanosensitive ion channel-like protein [Lutibacter oceani]|uniref:Mechanosensitive ion channel-like protein n=1 Tax=Lutibacter oceani TaxID=1853311 RepID=A0A3D9S1K0_9FLAO|nr:mechanosensitive ion channel domain-containing protein [Lutibacter oceani]REE83196.1 mechanosensitive ion channel-like protein [Lutibacter oceani]